LAENGSNDGKRGPYKPIEKARIKQEIYNKLLEGYSYPNIMEYMHMPERTFYHYLSAIKEEEKGFLVDTISKEELSWQIQLCRDRLLADRSQLKEWVKDSNFKEKVEATHLASELSSAVLRLHIYGPSYFSRYSSSNNNNNNNKQDYENNNNNKQTLTDLEKLNEELALEEEHMHHMGASAAKWEEFERRKKAFLEKYYNNNNTGEEEAVSQQLKEEERKRSRGEDGAWNSWGFE
jgi:hypothetical protein